MTTIYHRANSLLETVTESCQMLEKYKHDPSVTKTDVIECMEDKLGMIMGRIIAVPVSTSFHLFKSNDD